MTVGSDPSPASGAGRTAADAVAPLVRAILGSDLPVAFRFWDGSRIGPESSAATLVVGSPMALRRLLWSPGELGVARAYVAGELDVEGDLHAVLALADRLAADGPGVWSLIPRVVPKLPAAARIGALGRPPAPPPEEITLHGRLHTRARDAEAIAHHYDLSDDFYRLFLGETMTYSCAYFREPDLSLDDAQTAKYDLACRKLGLEPGMRLLDVGCGWGGMVLHAATHYGVTAVGVTVSQRQVELGVKRVADAGLHDAVDIRFADYRDLDDEPFDAISSIGMFEHVGVARLEEYFGGVFGLLRPGGRLLNHAISRPRGSRDDPPSAFLQRYVFPDGELHRVGEVATAMEERGFEVRDVESLREHYARTLGRWVAGLDEHWDDAVRLVGIGRTRVWRLYMAVSQAAFETGKVSIHQVLGVRPDAEHRSGMPPTRRGWAT